MFAEGISRRVVSSQEQSEMASSQFGANTAGWRRQKSCLKPVSLRGISSPLFRESLIDTWGSAWRASDNTSIVFSAFWIKMSVSRRVFAGVLAHLQTWTFSFHFFFFFLQKLPPARLVAAHLGEHHLWQFNKQAEWEKHLIVFISV